MNTTGTHATTTKKKEEKKVPAEFFWFVFIVTLSDCTFCFAVFPFRPLVIEAYNSEIRETKRKTPFDATIEPYFIINSLQRQLRKKQFKRLLNRYNREAILIEYSRKYSQFYVATL